MARRNVTHPTSTRCKPGDIAVSIGRNLGKIVQVVRLHTDLDEKIDGTWWNNDNTPAWVVHTLSGPFHCLRIDGITPDPKPHMTLVINDDKLRPLRDSDEADESLTWVTPLRAIKKPSKKGRKASKPVPMANDSAPAAQ